MIGENQWGKRLVGGNEEEMGRDCLEGGVSG